MRKIGIFFDTRSRPHTEENAVSQSLEDAIVHLAKTVLPDWEIINETSLEGKEWPQLDIAIADAYYNATGRKSTAPHRTACNWLNERKNSSEECYTILTATLPDSSNIFDDVDTTKIDRYISLAATNINAWDELTDLIRSVIKKKVYPEYNSTHDCTLKEFLEWIKNGSSVHHQNSFETKNDLIIEGQNVASSENETERQKTTRQIIDNLADVGLKGSICCRNFILRNIPSINCIDLRKSKTEGIFLIENCNIENRSLIVKNDFNADVNVVDCRFKSELFWDGNTFGGTASTCSGRRLPWFKNTSFEGEFCFRSNTNQRVVSELPNPQEHLPIMFSQCNFLSRFSLLFSEPPAKLTFYQCVFTKRAETDISYPYLCQGEHEKEEHTNKLFNRFVEGLNSENRPEVRFTFCHLDANIRLRESPSPASNLTNTDVIGARVLKYTPESGIGVNLSGTTLAGCLDFSHIRIAWINPDRMTVCGGSIITHHDSLTTLHLKNLDHREIISQVWNLDFAGLYNSAATFLTRVFLLAPQRVNFVFDEKTFFHEEPQRFSVHFRRSRRLEELNGKYPRDYERIHRIASQYETLRIAYSNGTNTYSEEDFCQFKRLFWLYKSDCLAIRRSDVIIATLLLLSYFFISFLAISAIRFFTGTVKFSLAFGWVGYIGIAYFIFVALGFRSTKRISRVIVGFLYRNMLGYLLYPMRVIGSTLLVISLFALCYGIVDSIDRFAEINENIISSTATAPSTPTPKSLVFSFFECIPRLMYFSCVTFTTLGYGDETPKGLLRSVANVEAILGAVWLSFITVAVLRHVTRK
jgi:hypothetical protein